MPSFAQAVIVTGKIIGTPKELPQGHPVDVHKYLLERLIAEDKSATDRATNMSIRGNVKLYRWFEDEETTNELMSHRLRNILPYGMAEFMRGS